MRMFPWVWHDSIIFGGRAKQQESCGVVRMMTVDESRKEVQKAIVVKSR